MASADNHDKAAQQTYSGFIAAVKWTTPLLILITAFVVFLITR